jgi:hydrogenase expression/formation protein HypE
VTLHSIRRSAISISNLKPAVPLPARHAILRVGTPAPEDAAAAPSALRTHPLGRDAAIIGTVQADSHHFVQMQTAFGGRRIVDWLSGEQLPRIC